MYTESISDSFLAQEGLLAVTRGKFKELFHSLIHSSFYSFTQNTLSKVLLDLRALL